MMVFYAETLPEPLSLTSDPEILLSRAEIYRNEENVSISCELTSNKSCVLVYQNNHTKLIVEEFTHSTVFPVYLTVDEDVTLFLFGKNGALQSEPILILREGETRVVYGKKTTSLLSLGTELYFTDAGGETSSSSSSGVLVGELVGSVVGCVVAFSCCVVAGIVLVLVVRGRRQKVRV